jgi:hypothetical protein
MHPQIELLRTPAEPAAPWSRHVQEDRFAARDTSAGAAGAAANVERAHDEAPSWRALLARYLEGWAEVNMRKIFTATAHGYRFDDPLVGTFSRWMFPVYFERVAASFARTGAVATKDLAFCIHGPMHGAMRLGQLEFYRAAPRLGLTGITVITVGAYGVISESVAYDLNLATELLRAQCGEPA